jgi:glycosyltransferase involved in cell wall biosynthesis
MITVIIPTIEPRAELLERAVKSVLRQTCPAGTIIVANDVNRIGAAANRDYALSLVTTEYVACLDDDDEFYPQHLEKLLNTLEHEGADLVYSWYDVVGGHDPFPQWEGVPWDNEQIHLVPITWLARTEVVRAHGGFNTWDADAGPSEQGFLAGEDFMILRRIARAGQKIVHHPERTWAWHHHGANTMGLPTRW